MALDATGAFEELEGHGALVVVSGTDSGDAHGPYAGRPAAPFLAHLIATASGEPQTRRHCRARPDAAAQAYATMSAVTSRNSGA